MFEIPLIIFRRGNDLKRITAYVLLSLWSKRNGGHVLKDACCNRRR